MIYRSVKATERSMHVSLYMGGPLGRAIQCWASLACPYWSSCTLVAFVGGGGETKTPQRAPLRSWPHIRLYECSIRFWLFLTGLRAPWLLGEGCYVQTGCAITASVLAHAPFSLAQKSAPPQLRWEAGVGSQTPARNPAPELAPNAAVLNP